MRSTVVIVEDEALIRLSACDLFQDAGIEVVDFANGDDAIDYIRDHKSEVAAIFTDIELPGDTDGLELAGIVSEACPDIAVMVTSGQVVGRPRDLHPLVRYIEKPWAPAEVLTTVQSALKAA